MRRAMLPRLPENPVLSRELRTRMRGSRSPWLLFAYVGTLALILFVVYFQWARYQDDGISGGMGSAAFTIGRTFYEVLFVIQALLVTLITPALTAGGVSIEREQRTYEMLSVSLLPRRSVVTGKLAAAVAFVGLLLTASLPLVSLCFLLGGVSPGEVGASYVSLLATAFVYGAAGMAWSSVARDTTAATLLAYGTVLLLFFATLPLAVPWLPGFYTGSGAFGLAALNPVGAVLFGTRPEAYFGRSVPAWVPAVAVNVVLGTILAVASLHRLEYPITGRAWPLRVLTLGLCAALVALFTGFQYAPGASPVPGMPPGGGGSAGVAAATRRAFICWLVAFLPCVLAPIFATGAGLRGEWPRHRRRAGDPLTGLAFVVAASSLCAVILVAFAGGSNRTGLPALTMIVPCVAFGLGGIALLCSAALRNRWTALQAALTLCLMLFFLPYSVVTARWNGDNWKPSALDALVYLSPIPAAIQSAEPQRFSTTAADANWARTGARARTLPLRDTPFAPVTAALYFAFGLVAVPLAFLLDGTVQKRAARIENAAPPE